MPYGGHSSMQLFTLHAYALTLGPGAHCVVAHMGSRPVSQTMVSRDGPLVAAEKLASTECIVVYLPMRVPTSKCVRRADADLLARPPPFAPAACPHGRAGHRQFVATARLHVPGSGLEWPISRTNQAHRLLRVPTRLAQFSPCGKWLLIIGGLHAGTGVPGVPTPRLNADMGLTLLDMGVWEQRVETFGYTDRTGLLGMWCSALGGAERRGGPPGLVSGIANGPSLGARAYDPAPQAGDGSGVPLLVAWARAGMWTLPDYHDLGCVFLGARAVPTPPQGAATATAAQADRPPAAAAAAATAGDSGSDSDSEDDSGSDSDSDVAECDAYVPPR